MCNTQALIRAAGNIKSASDKRKALKIARQMEKGKADQEDVIWITRITASIRTSHRAHT